MIVFLLETQTSREPDPSVYGFKCIYKTSPVSFSDFIKLISCECLTTPSHLVYLLDKMEVQNPENVGLLSGVQKPSYNFNSSIIRERKRRLRQFQCCLCVTFM